MTGELTGERLLLSLVAALIFGVIGGAILLFKGRSSPLLGFALGFLFSLIGVIIVIVIALVMSPSDEAKLEGQIRRGAKRRCSNCGIAMSSKERFCPECGQRLYPLLRRITRDSIDSLFACIDRGHLALSPEAYHSNAQAYAYNWQLREASVELAKVLLISSPDSEIHQKARRKLERLGFRFPARDFLDLVRQGKNEWWRYLLSLAVIFIGWVVLSVAIGFIVGVSLGVIISLGGHPGVTMDEGSVEITDIHPALVLAVILLSFAGLLGALFWRSVLSHQRPFLSLITRRLRFDWRRAAAGFMVFFLLAAASSLVESFIYPGSYHLTWKASEFLIFLPVVVLLVPMQSAAEEFLCRGYLMQGLGLISRRLFFPAVSSSLIFMALHLGNSGVIEQPVFPLIYYFSTGLLLAAVTLRDGRMELAIGILPQTTSLPFS